VDNEDQQRGVNIVLEAMTGPIRQMAQNAGLSPDLIVSEVSADPAPMGFNFRSLEKTNLLTEGVLDPVKVTTTALQNAVSAASTLITTNYAIIQS
jgi:chaperonin GroEL